MLNFDRKTHTYTLNGERLPSVTQVLKTVLFPHTYAFVDEEVLERAAEFGTNVHKALDTRFPDPLTDEELNSYHEAIKIIEKNGFVPIMKETKIHSKLGFAGTFDLYADMGNGRFALIDYKTTSRVLKDEASWQLSMYKVALEEIGKVVHGLYVISIPKNKKGKLVSIEIKNKIEIEWLMTTYKERTMNNG